jgi:hypothetical protein
VQTNTTFFNWRFCWAGVETPSVYMNRMYDTDTTNKAFFTKVEKTIGAFA